MSMFEPPSETPSRAENAAPREQAASAAGPDGMLERFFAVSLDSRAPRYAPASEPGLLESRALRAVEAAERALRDSPSSYGDRGGSERRARVHAAEEHARRMRDDSVTARTILTRAREDYAQMVNTGQHDRRGAALEVIAHIEEADKANDRVLARLLDREYRDLTGAAHAAREGTLAYSGPRPHAPYEVPDQAPPVILTPGEARRQAVAAAQAAITRDLKDLQGTISGSASGNTAISTGVSPLVAEAFLKTLRHDLQDGALNNNSRAEVDYRGLRFVPLDRRHHSVSEEAAAGIDRLEKALRSPGGAEVDASLARDIVRVSKMLTGKAVDTAVLQGPAATPAGAATGFQTRRP